MKNIKNKLDNAIYGYELNEFLPIFYDGKLENKGAFVAYKLKSMIAR